MKYILALDQGTTSSRALLLGEDGKIYGNAQTEFKQMYPRPGWVEHDAAEIWSTQFGVAMEVLAQADAQPSALAGIGITNQRETIVVWDRKSGEPVANAIVWQDRRTAPFCDELRNGGHETLIRDKTGLVIDPYFSASKIRWLLDNVQGARERAHRGDLACGTIDSWLVWKLTGGERHVTDATNASRTMLFNIHTQEWDDELLTLLDIPRSLLPEVVDSSGVCGHATGVLSRVPIGGLAGDQHASLFGQMCTEPGMVKCTYGTGSFMLQNTGSKAVVSRNRLLTTVAWRIDGTVSYALEGSVFVAGAVVQWLRDGLGIIRSSDEMAALAGSVPDTGDVYFVPAFAGLGAPHWDPYARGTIVGLTRGTTRGHIARAALEGIAFQVADILGAIESDSGVPVKELRVDGGAARNDLLMQMQADLLNAAVTRPANTETTVLGAAYLAGLATGIWPDRDAIQAQWKVDRQFVSKFDTSQRAHRLERWRQALERAKAWHVD